MRVSPMLTAMILCAASIGAAHAQTVTPGFGRSTDESSRSTSGMSFAYDAQHGQINANGIQLNPTTIKSNSVSPTTGTATNPLTHNNNQLTEDNISTNTNNNHTHTVIDSSSNLDYEAINPNSMQTITSFSIVATAGRRE